MLLLLVIATFSVLQHFGAQAAFTFSIDDIVAVESNPEYLGEIDTYLSDDSRNALIVNFTIIKALPDTCEGHMSLLGASMGQYILPSGIDVRLPMCDMINEPIIMGPILKVLGFSKCPVVPGLYGSDGYIPPTENFPDEFPPNKYMVEFEIINGDEKIGVVHVFMEIQ